MSIVNQNHQRIAMGQRKIMTYQDLRMQKRKAKKAANELYYKNVMPDVMTQIDEAKNLAEVNLVMKTCRNLM